MSVADRVVRVHSPTTAIAKRHQLRKTARELQTRLRYSARKINLDTAVSSSTFVTEFPAISHSVSPMAFSIDEMIAMPTPTSLLVALTLCDMHSHHNMLTQIPKTPLDAEGAASILSHIRFIESDSDADRRSVTLKTSTTASTMLKQPSAILTPQKGQQDNALTSYPTPQPTHYTVAAATSTSSRTKSSTLPPSDDFSLNPSFMQTSDNETIVPQDHSQPHYDHALQPQNITRPSIYQPLSESTNNGGTFARDPSYSPLSPTRSPSPSARHLIFPQTSPKQAHHLSTAGIFDLLVDIATEQSHREVIAPILHTVGRNRSYTPFSFATLRHPNELHLLN